MHPFAMETAAIYWCTASIDFPKWPLWQLISLGHTLIHRKRVWYFTVTGFVLLSQLPQAAVGVLSIFIVRVLLEIIARAIYSCYLFCNAMEV